jgi:site-specific DNA-methyltransferase (adenine-specific)
LKVVSGRNPKYRVWFEFKTEMEALNFIKYSKTYFSRGCLSLVKTNKNIAQNELSFIPSMDFTQEWTDEKLYAHFNITEEEQAFIKEIIPPYYD